MIVDSRFDADCLRTAIQLSLDSIEQGGGPFGAVVVCDGAIVGRGTNQVTTHLDPTAHAEVVAIRDACHTLERFSLTGCELYASCQPCPMCLAAIVWARLDVVFFGCTADDASAIGFDDARIYEALRTHNESTLVPSASHLRDEALVAFERWTAKSDRVPY